MGLPKPAEPQTLITPFAEPLRPAPVEVVTNCHGLSGHFCFGNILGFLPAVACFPAPKGLRLAELGTLRLQLWFWLLAATLAGCSPSPSLLKIR